MHEDATNIRTTAAYLFIGADQTQSIALDELWGKKEEVRTTRATRKTTRMTRATVGQPMLEDDKVEEEEEVEIQTRVMRGQGLCRGKLCINLWCMIWLWSATIVDYFVINIYLKYIPGSEYLNQTVAGVSEIAAHIVVGMVIQRWTPKWTFIIGYILTTMGGAALIFMN